METRSHPYVLAIAAAALTLSTAADVARAKGGGGGGGTPPPTAAFTISSPSQSPTSIAAGQTVALRFNVKSAQAASNVDVYVVVQNAGGTDVRLDVRDLTFGSGETKTITVNYKARATDRIGTKFWVAEVYQNLVLKAQLYTQRLGIVMNFEQTTGVSIFEPFGPEFDNVCDNESTFMYVPCSLGSLTVNFKALYVNDYFPDGYRVIPAGCTQTGSTVVCDGGTTDVVRRWNGSSTAVTDIPGVRNIAAAVTIDPQLGDQRTLAIINDPNVATDSAADFCANLDYSGFTDWHLPSKSELALLFCRSMLQKSASFPQEMPGCSSTTNYGYGIGFPGINSLGNPNGLPFNPSIYLSSTEVDASNVWALDFSTGREIVVPKSTAASVRCIRKPYGLKY